MLNTVVSWKRLNKLRWPIREGCAWISDASIQHCLKNHLLEDAREPQTELAHHDARIAFIIRRLQAGKKIDKLHLRVRADRITIMDGAHRLRAYQFLGQDNIEVYITASTPGLLQEFKERYNTEP
jgi:hypothetical protein